MIGRKWASRGARPVRSCMLDNLPIFHWRKSCVRSGEFRCSTRKLETFSLGLYLVSNSISIRHRPPRARRYRRPLRALPKMCLSCVEGRCVRGNLVPCTRTRQRRRGSMRVRAPRFGRAVELGSGADPPPWRAGGRRNYGATWARVGHPRTTRVSSRSEYAHPGSVSTSRHP